MYAENPGRLRTILGEETIFGLAKCGKGAVANKAYNKPEWRDEQSEGDDAEIYKLCISSQQIGTEPRDLACAT